jgi:hypothetical protein
MIARLKKLQARLPPQPDFHGRLHLVVDVLVDADGIWV